MKEIEQVLLEVNVEEFLNKIESRGAIFKNKGVEKQYNFDFSPIDAQFEGIEKILSVTEYSRREKGLALNRLKSLIYDVDDLIKNHPKNDYYLKEIKKNTGHDSLMSYFLESKNKNSAWFNQISYYFKIFKTNPNKWARIKLLPSGKTSIAVKQIMNRKVEIVNGKEVRTHSKEDVFETEVIVDNFEDATKLMNSLGYFAKSFTERERISYEFEDIEIEIDVYPHIPPFAEIEGPTSEHVENAIAGLSLEQELRKTFDLIGNKSTLNHDDIYSFYGLDIQKEFSIL